MMKRRRCERGMDGTNLGLPSFSLGFVDFRSFPIMGRVSAGMMR